LREGRIVSELSAQLHVAVRTDLYSSVAVASRPAAGSFVPGTINVYSPAQGAGFVAAFKHGTVGQQVSRPNPIANRFGNAFQPVQVERSGQAKGRICPARDVIGRAAMEVEMPAEE